jgi:hypothetical protein
MLRRELQQVGVDQRVVNDDIGAPQQFGPPHGEQPGIAGAGAHKVNSSFLHPAGA